MTYWGSDKSNWSFDRNRRSKLFDVLKRSISPLKIANGDSKKNLEREAFPRKGKFDWVAPVGEHIKPRSRHTAMTVWTTHRKPADSRRTWATLFVFLTVGLLLYVQTAAGQIIAPKAPTFQNNFSPPVQPWTPHRNNDLTPTDIPKQKIATPVKFDRPPIADQQRQLESIYHEIRSPERSISESNVKYHLPSFASLKGTSAYRTAFSKLKEMENGRSPFSIKEANFLVENAHFENTGNYENFNRTIQQIGQFLNWKMEELGNDGNSNQSKNLILYQFFSDTLELRSKDMIHYPFLYDFEDYMGFENWNNMFVEKALSTNSGQCHSLPLLYLILAEQIGAKAHLAYSPNHSYIKFIDDAGKWHNVELTNGMLTTDVFILQSGYIKAEALQSDIYMNPLNEKQLLSHVLFDLAKGYAVKYGYDEFVKEVIDNALELYPNSINAHMVMSDFKTLRFQYVQKQLNINTQNIDNYPKAQKLLDEMHAQYKILDDLGYEDMPLEDYEKWLNSLQESQMKQESQLIEQKLNLSIPKE